MKYNYIRQYKLVKLSLKGTFNNLVYLPFNCKSISRFPKYNRNLDFLKTSYYLENRIYVAP